MSELAHARYPRAVARLLAACLVLLLVALTTACDRGPVFTVIGRPGRGPAEFDQPRAVGVSEAGLAVIDRSGRLQVLDLEGSPQTVFPVTDPQSRRGFPLGVSWLDPDTLAVADTHRSVVLLYGLDGERRLRVGEYGARPGEFVQPQRLQLLSSGELAVTDHGIDIANRVQVFSRDGTHLRTFGGPEPEDGGLRRPLGFVELSGGRLVVADQVAGLREFDSEGRFVRGWPLPDDVTLLYGLTRAPAGDLFATDLATDSVLRIAPDGTYQGRVGGTGVEPGRFREPWDVAFHAGELYVADRMNHRVQRFDPERVEWRQE